MIHVKKQSPKELQTDEHITQTLRRLKSQGLNEEGEEKIARLKDVLLKVNLSKTRYGFDFKRRLEIVLLLDSLIRTARFTLH